MLIRPLLVAALTAVAASSGSAVAAGTPHFAYQSFTVPGSLTTVARDFGEGASVVGYELSNKGLFDSFTEHADGSVIPFSVPGARETLVYANSHGRLMGQAVYSFGTGGTMGFVQDASGAVVKLQVPAGQDTAAYGMNASRTIVGTYSPDSGGEEAGFVLQDGVYTPYVVANSFDTELTGIDDRGRLVGSYRLVGNGDESMPFVGFLDDQGVRRDIRFPGAFDTMVTGINNVGQVVGYYDTAIGSGFIGFVYDGKHFVSVAPPGATSTYAWHIDDDGRVVGHGFLSGDAEASFVATPRRP